MIYLDNGATSFHKPECVYRAVVQAMHHCANPGRGGYPAAMQAAKTLYECRERAGRLFDCEAENVIFTSNCTHGLNIAIRSLLRPDARVAVTGFEHNAVMRPLYAMGCKTVICGRSLFHWESLLHDLELALRSGIDGAVFTHVSNVFGYIMPLEQMAKLCQSYGVPFVVDAAQSAGILPVKLRKLGAAYIAMPGHKGLLGPQGTGLLLCSRMPEPIFFGGTGSLSASRDMPDFLPERAEAGTGNVPGIAGLSAGIAYISRIGTSAIMKREHEQMRLCANGLHDMGYQVFEGEHQSGTLSFIPKTDCEEAANWFSRRGIAVRAGLHCAPLAHESAGTLSSGTVRISFGHDASFVQTSAFLHAAGCLQKEDS